MIVRSASRCRQTLRPTLHRAAVRTSRFTPSRRFSTPASTAPQSSVLSSAGLLAPFTNELDKLAPSFQINGSQIEVIQTPTEFYETLKAKIRGAKRQIFLSTLYIGKSESELVCMAGPWRIKRDRVLMLCRYPPSRRHYDATRS